ncbi:Uncharacterised protein [[Flavobacterium] thermophilum]|nr:Uncharacterised protein [[Flavobacterium] thermophilum]
MTVKILSIGLRGLEGYRVQVEVPRIVQRACHAPITSVFSPSSCANKTGVIIFATTTRSPLRC